MTKQTDIYVIEVKVDGSWQRLDDIEYYGRYQATKMRNHIMANGLQARRRKIGRHLIEILSARTHH